ncbi:hypothetical protein BC829DRAFT_439073 [Chytridium lagenaria]|nr:hypothetical protein BC829DRAFT_439073 [Chytridium lagenaria]
MLYRLRAFDFESIPYSNNSLFKTTLTLVAISCVLLRVFYKFLFYAFQTCWGRQSEEPCEIRAHQASLIETTTISTVEHQPLQDGVAVPSEIQSSADTNPASEILPTLIMLEKQKKLSGLDFECSFQIADSIPEIPLNADADIVSAATAQETAFRSKLNPENQKIAVFLQDNFLSDVDKFLKTSLPHGRPTGALLSAKAITKMEMIKALRDAARSEISLIWKMNSMMPTNFAELINRSHKSMAKMTSDVDLALDSECSFQTADSIPEIPLNADAAIVSAETAALRVLQSEKNELTDTCTQLREERDSLQRQTILLEQAFDRTEKRLEELHVTQNKRLCENEAELARKDEMTSFLQQQLADVNVAFKASKVEKDEVYFKNIRLQEQIDSEAQRNQSLEQEVRGLRNGDTISKLQQDLERNTAILNESTQTARRYKEGLLQEIQGRDEELSRVQLEVHKVTRISNDHANAHAKALVDIESRDKTIRELQLEARGRSEDAKTHQAILEALSQCQEEIEGLSNALEKERGKNEALSEIETALSTRLKDANSVIATTNTRLQELELSFTNMSARLQEAESFSNTANTLLQETKNAATTHDASLNEADNHAAVVEALEARTLERDVLISENIALKASLQTAERERAEKINEADACRRETEITVTHFRASLEEANSVIATTNARVENSEHFVATMLAHAAAARLLRLERDGLINENLALKASLQQVETEKTEKINKVDARRWENELAVTHYRASLEEANSVIVTTNARIERFERDAANMRARLQAAERSAERRAAQAASVKEITDRHSAAAQALEACRLERDGLTNENLALKASLQQAETEKVSEADARLRETEITVTHLKARLEEADSVIASTSARLQESNAKETVEGLRTRLAGSTGIQSTGNPAELNEIKRIHAAQVNRIKSANAKEVKGLTEECRQLYRAELALEYSSLVSWDIVFSKFIGNDSDDVRSEASSDFSSAAGDIESDHESPPIDSEMNDANPSASLSTMAPHDSPNTSMATLTATFASSLDFVTEAVDPINGTASASRLSFVRVPKTSDHLVKNPTDTSARSSISAPRSFTRPLPIRKHSRDEDDSDDGDSTRNEQRVIARRGNKRFCDEFSIESLLAEGPRIVIPDPPNTSVAMAAAADSAGAMDSIFQDGNVACTQ